LNIGGQRGRSTLVQVDGSDFTDNSINAARTTVSQEAVQEFQVATNSYAPEFGRATGGIINVVTNAARTNTAETFSALSATKACKPATRSRRSNRLSLARSSAERSADPAFFEFRRRRTRHDGRQR
jgi:outer membrane receptor protein involved in Fe transport